MPLRPLLASLLLLVSVAASAATEVLTLNYRTSDELLPIAQNFIGRDGKVSGYGNQLIVNARAEKVQSLRELLAQLDKPSRRLLISVDTTDSNDQNRNGYSVNGAGQTRIISRSTASRSGGMQQVQASEGVPALVQVGQSVPFTSSQTDSYGGLQTQTQYRDVTRGFYVTASVTGSTVHLNISTHNDRMSQQRQDVVDMQSANTQVSGRLGEWITLAGMNEQSQGNTGEYTQNWSTQGRSDMTVRVKVDSLE